MDKAKKILINVMSVVTKSPTRIIVLGFGLVIFIGAFFLALPIAHNSGQWFSFSDALFTATSATCVTGLVVVDTATEFNGFGQFVILLLIQIGGLGVMTGTTIIFIALGRRLSLRNKLLLQESLSETPISGIVKMIKRVIIYTFVIELIGAVLLMCSLIPRYGAIGIWQSVFLSISAFCNAGFDILGVVEQPFSSLTPFAQNIFVLLPIMMLVVLGGIGFMVLTDISGFKKRKRLQMHTKVVLIITAVLIAIGWIVYAAAEWNHALNGLSVWGKLVSSLFQSITPRTAGFNTIDQAAMTPISYVTTLLFMFIGASPSSTGGGIKTTTFIMLILITIATLRGRNYVNIGQSRVTDFTIRKVITIVVIATATIIISIGAIALIEAGNGIKLKDIVFESVSAFATVGLSLGITPKLSSGSLFILGMVMFIGRVGALTIGASLVRFNGVKNHIKYGDAKILVG